MQIIIHRIFIHKDTSDGILKIKGKRICDTSEHTPVMLPVGRYIVELKRTKPFNRIMPVIVDKDKQKLGILQYGNGVYTLKDGTFILGKRRTRGLCIHSKKHFNKLFERLKKVNYREEEIELQIIENNNYETNRTFSSGRIHKKSYCQRTSHPKSATGKSHTGTE